MLLDSVCRLTASIVALSAIANADPPPFTAENIEAYDRGEYGLYPEIKFRTTDFPGPHVLLRHWEPSCSADEDDYYFLTPYGAEVENPGPIILDGQGNLVWHHESSKFIHSYGLMVQEYQGQNYLTWWTGDDWVHGHGFGSYYMFDDTYMPYKKLGAYNDAPADLHEFHITKENRVLVTAYVKTKTNFSYWNKEDGFIWDGYFQEFDLATNELIFEWKASEHIALESSALSLEFKPNTVGGNGTEQFPWDYFHINSVDKDERGNYLISGRNYCALVYINGRTGEVEWRLGGKDNDFKDLSDGRALDFAWQHHARWTDNHTTITFFDNHVRWATLNTRPSRGMKLAIDESQKTAKIIHEFSHPMNVTGESQGSFQQLENGNFLMGFGHAPAFTEYAPDGSVVCDLSFAPLRASDKGQLRYGIVESYRAFKLRWKATPYYDPKVHIDRAAGKIFVSWNGATEVRMWRLDAARARNNWAYIDQIPKAGFESNFTVVITDWNVFRLSAYDRSNTVIRSWLVNPSGIVQAERISVPQADEPKSHVSETEYLGSIALLVIGILLFVLGIASAGYFIFERYVSRRDWTSIPANEGEVESRISLVYDEKLEYSAQSATSLDLWYQDFKHCLTGDGR